MVLSLLKGFRKTKKAVYTFHKKDFPITGHFITSRGENISLLEGFREELKPNWRQMVMPREDKFTPMSEDKLSSKVTSSKKRMNGIGKFLSVNNVSLKNKDVLEVGCYDGVAMYCVTELGPNKIVGADLSEYYINQSQGGSVCEESKKRQFEVLTAEREHLRKFVSKDRQLAISDHITFIEDDIRQSKLQSNSFDFIFGLEVMEHVLQPLKSLKEMHRIVRPGGFVFHEYNPFFCLEGGHSLCTLDFPWGHVRLDGDDFIRYTNSFRKDEAMLDQSFFFNNLNRMTLADLNSFIIEAGFNVIDLVQWNENLVPDILKDPDILSQSRRNHPALTINDLITDRVWLLLKKEK